MCIQPTIAQKNPIYWKGEFVVSFIDWEEMLESSSKDSEVAR